MSFPLSVIYIGAAIALLVPWLVILFFKHKRAWTICLFVLYLLIMILGVFCRFSIQNGRFYIGFAIDKRMWFAASKFAVYCGGKNNIIINLTMFLPFGLATAFLAKKHKLLKALIFGFLASLTIEFLQFALPINRTPELFDVAANTLSSVMGAIYCYIILFIKKFVDKIKLKSAK